MKHIVFEGYEGPRLSREQQLRRLNRVIDTELTEKQRYVLRGYYQERKNMPQLARELHINKSSVCRMLQRAEHRLKRCLHY